MKNKINWLLLLLGIPVAVLSIIFHTRPEIFVLGTIVLALIGVVVNSFVVVYSFRNWRANAYGRGLMYAMISLAILTDLSLLTSFLGPDWEWRSATRLFLFGGILVAHGRLLQLLFSAKRQDEQKIKEAEQNE